VRVQVSACAERLLHCRQVAVVGGDALLSGDAVGVGTLLPEPVACEARVDEGAEEEVGEGESDVDDGEGVLDDGDGVTVGVLDDL
jgi:hypothetical protein